jgi:glycosyltransferase involved in cell wall biosynthesis
VSPSLRRLGRRGGGQEPLRVPIPDGLLEVLRDGPAPLAPRRPDFDSAALRLAWIVPQFRRGSGGHATIANLIRGLEALGHRSSVWVLDEEGRHAGASDASIGRLWGEFFGPIDGEVRLGVEGCEGADVAIATGWQTVPRTLRLPGAASRAYLVQDHEPEFYPTSASREWAEWTYRQGVHCIAASAWLAQLLRDRYGATAGHFDLGVDHEVYRPLSIRRREELVLFYARASTPRRAVPLGALALQELRRRRPDVDIIVFGEPRPLELGVPHRSLGVVPPTELAQAYNAATVGLVLSMTNPSLVPTEMLACGLPVVDLDVPSMRTAFGPDGPIALAPSDPIALCDRLDALLDDVPARASRARAGLELAAERTWLLAARQVASTFVH